MNELWSDIGDNYSISSEGRIRNDKTGRILREYKDKVGRPRVKVCLSNKRNISIPREVYKAFIDKDLKRTDLIYRIDKNKPASKDNIYLYKSPIHIRYKVGDIIHKNYEILAYEKMVKSCSVRHVFILKCKICGCICLCDIANIDKTKKHRCLCNVKKSNILI